MLSSQARALEDELSIEERPKERVALLLALNKSLAGTDFNRGAELCAEAVSLAVNLADETVLAQCHTELARTLWKIGEMVEAQRQYELALLIYTRLKDDLGLASVYCGLGIVHGTLEDHANAMEFFEKGIEAAKRCEDDVILAHNLGNLGHVYKGLGDYSTALRYFAKALAIDRELGEDGRHGVSNMLTAIAGAMVFQEEYEGAIEKLNESLTILEELGDMRGMATALSNMGITYHRMGQLTNAITYLNRSLALANKIHYRILIPDLHKNLADLFTETGDESLALEHLQQRNEFQMEEKRLEIQRKAGQIIDAASEG